MRGYTDAMSISGLIKREFNLGIPGKYHGPTVINNVTLCFIEKNEFDSQGRNISAARNFITSSTNCQGCFWTFQTPVPVQSKPGKLCDAAN